MAGPVRRTRRRSASKSDRMDIHAVAKLAAIRAYVNTNSVPEAALTKMAKLGIAIERFMKDTHCTVSAVPVSYTHLDVYKRQE